MTMVEINRVWLNVDTDTNKITLFVRPRVSIHVDEYIWGLIEEHIVKPHKLMRSEKHRYLKGHRHCANAGVQWQQSLLRYG